MLAKPQTSSKVGVDWRCSRTSKEDAEDTEDTEDTEVAKGRRRYRAGSGISGDGWMGGGEVDMRMCES